MSDARELAGQIRAVVEGARPVPMSSSAVVNRPELLSLVDRLEKTLAAGHVEAGQIVAQAEQERDRLVSQTEVYATAERAAQELLGEAHRESAELHRETDAYVDTTFAHLQVALTKTLSALERGRDRLAGRSELDSLGRDDADDSTLPALPS